MTTPAPYGPSNFGYNYGPHSPQLAFYPQQTPVPNNAINYTQTEGFPYPDRRYPLFQPHPYIGDDPGFIYSALLQPDISHYNPADWWKRYARSENSGKKKRNKRQSASGEIQLCPTRSRFIMPKAALNSQGNWMYVVNLERDQNRFTQEVRSEVCVSNECNGICDLPNGYTSRCEQQFVQKRLVALESRGNNLYTDTFWFPHCCVCKITEAGSG
uniref:Spaetzle domain-containing protein n=2 Tax=Clastoptera arizonana TaxID=38151 RepID=A0A1B6DZ39_9HEMI